MGGEFNSEVLRGKTKEDIMKKWNDMVEQDLHENGHSYSGSIGMLGSGFTLKPTVFKTIEEAEEQICDEHSKWDSAIAYQIKNELIKTGEIVYVIGGWCSS